MTDLWLQTTVGGTSASRPQANTHSTTLLFVSPVWCVRSVRSCRFCHRSTCDTLGPAAGCGVRWTTDGTTHSRQSPTSSGTWELHTRTHPYKDSKNWPMFGLDRLLCPANGCMPQADRSSNPLRIHPEASTGLCNPLRTS